MTTRALLSLALLAACSTATTSSGSQAGDDAAIRAINGRIQQAITARDAALVTSFYAPDARLYPPNAPAVTGSAAIMETWKEVFAMPNFELTFTSTAVEFAAARDMATDAGTFRMAFDGPDGRVTDEGKYAVVWRKAEGDWKISSEMWNSSRPMPEPPKAVAAAPIPGDGSEMEILATGGLTWAPLEVPGFKPGIQMAAIHGDPTKEGDYTVRLRFPDGYEFPAHWHPKGEHLTVLRGSFRLGMGEKENPAVLKTYAPGDFLYIPAKMPHFGGAKGVTEIQLHGIGPFEIMLATQS